MGYVFAADSIIMSRVPSFPCSGAQKHMRADVSCNIARNDRSRLSKVIDRLWY